MRTLARGWLIALLSVVATLLVPVPATAAVGDVYLLAAAGPSGTPQYLRPLVQTAAGFVYRNIYASTTWVASNGITQQEDRLADPVVIGDLLSSYVSTSTTLRWRTIADATLRETVLPPELTYVTRTANGYLARQGNGPYDLVAVDLLGGGTSTVIGAAAQFDGAIPGPIGVAVPNIGTDEWLYYPYDGSTPAGQVVQAPAGADACHLSTAHLFCWSATTLARLPLTGDPGATTTASPVSLVETADGIAYMTPDTRYAEDGWHEVWVWRSGEASPVVARTAGSFLVGQLAPVTDGTALALVARDGTNSDAGIYRISNAYAVSKIRGTTTYEPRTATAIAIGPGQVAWRDNASSSGSVSSRRLIPQADGGLTLGITQAPGYGSDGTPLSVSGPRVVFGRKDGLKNLEIRGFSDPQLSNADLNDGEATQATVSGWRMVWQRHAPGGDLSWQMIDLTRIINVSRTVTPLPDALSYDLWGERMARLDADGSVWLYDLRTATAPVQIAPALAGGAVGGTVRVAGDLVGWDIEPADPAAPDLDVRIRDVATMDAAETVSGLSELQDLSTGYAVGHGCSQDGSCSPRAVSLADGAVTSIDTERPMAVDGNMLAFITATGLPAVRVLPPYSDAPRLLSLPTRQTSADVRNGEDFEVRVSASQPLTSCGLEIRDADDELVHTEPCLYTGDGGAMVRWDGSTPTAYDVYGGIYTWRIVAANDGRSLVDYDGSTAVLSGTVTIEGPLPPIPVPMPDLGFAHRRSDGGMNLFRMPLSELEYGAGLAYPVRSLPASSGFRADRSRVLAGDFGNLTAGDDGTADHVVWHAGTDGGVRVYAVAGSSDTTPRLLHVLPRTAGWSWADSRPLVGDVNGDGWDDLLVVHRARVNVVWALISDGTRLGVPRKWGSLAGDFASMRNYVADADFDGNDDLLTTGPAAASFRTTALLTRPDGTAALPATDSHIASFPAADGWSLAYSRQLAGDVTADGMADLVTVHRSGNGGVLVWVNANCSAAVGDVCWEAPVRWQTLSNGWSFANSRQYLADSDGDYVLDLISVHRSGAGGIFVWRHLSDYSVLRAPQQIAALPTSAGWNWSLSRESVADTWGLWEDGYQTAGERGGDVGSTRTTR